MKKIVLALMAVFTANVTAQNYPDYYPQNDDNDNGYYSDADNRFYFPEDYYYEYPSDYYADDFYISSYNDYRRSIDDINWSRFFAQNRLAPWQIEQIIHLNSMYASFSVWNDYYRFNPDRWYYDRFYALERILGVQVFVVFQNVYYNGYSPVMYWRDYRIRHYAPMVYVRPVYRNININMYRVNRRDYHRNNGYYYSPTRQSFGFRNGAGGNRANGNSGFRSNDRLRNNDSGFRDNTRVQRAERIQGMRNGSSETRANSGREREITDNSGTRNDGGMRNTQQPRRNHSEGFKSERTESKSYSGQRNSSSETRDLGTRLVSR
ncbi:MAG: hypothetical protein QM564_12080 [Bergeyella sp.]